MSGSGHITGTIPVRSRKEKIGVILIQCLSMTLIPQSRIPTQSFHELTQPSETSTPQMIEAVKSMMDYGASSLFSSL
jgi:hypothetical protein